MTGKVGDLYWHVHHEILFEPLTEPLEHRVTYIRANKPPEEIETRLQLMKPVRGKLNPPNYWQEAYAKWQEADAKWQEADAKWQEAYAKLREAYAKRQEAYAKLREAGQEAYAKRQEAGAEWQEADAKWQEAYAKWRSSPSWAKVEAIHREECPNCPWNGRTIFP